MSLFSRRKMIPKLERMILCERVKKVVRSCKTWEQFMVARKYAELARNNYLREYHTDCEGYSLPTSLTKMIDNELRTVLSDVEHSILFGKE